MNSVSNRPVLQYKTAQPSFGTDIYLTGENVLTYIKQINKLNIIDKFTKEINDNPKLQDDLTIIIDKNTNSMGDYLQVKAKRLDKVYNSSEILAKNNTAKNKPITFEEQLNLIKNQIIKLYSTK